ncbi:MAG: hydrogenase formation protein HypD [Firmicutes bacterium]|nr:hydrogenase formation protein HypD [Bacillota bacterium]
MSDRVSAPRVNLMEVCGTHTMSIAKSGIKQLLPEGVRLISGPGCPVCVTSQGDIDAMLELSSEKDVIITTYGDMIRVPGSVRGDSLRRRKSEGADVRVVYSPADAVRIAREHPEKQTVFLGVGFETTAPGTAAAVKIASEAGVRNFTIYTALKRVEPALRALIGSEGFNVQGFLCPGHVAVITGEAGFRFLADEFGIPAVISGFEPEDIVRSIGMLLAQIRSGEARLENQYTRAVRPEGNPLALAMTEQFFETASCEWRGMGTVEDSAYVLRPEYSGFDAAKRFGVSPKKGLLPKGCLCGEVIQGRLDPALCPMFGKACSPEDPLGPCMVSSEGACAAAYKYGSFPPEKGVN